MNKRLRKKKHLAEYKELVFKIDAQVKLADDEALDKFWSKFMDKAEELNLECNGVFAYEEVEVYLYTGLIGTGETERREQMIAWMQEQPEVSSVTASELIDSFYEEFAGCCCGCSE